MRTSIWSGWSGTPSQPSNPNPSRPPLVRGGATTPSPDKGRDGEGLGGREGLEFEARANAIIAACKEVGPALFFSLLIITVSFLPVFTLEAQEGRLFSPLAFTKTFAMAGAALLSVTLVPVLMMIFVRGRIMPEAKNPVNRFLIWLYRPIIAWVMQWKKLTIVLAVAALSCQPVSGHAAGQRIHAHAQ